MHLDVVVFASTTLPHEKKTEILDGFYPIPYFGPIPPYLHGLNRENAVHPLVFKARSGPDGADSATLDELATCSIQNGYNVAEEEAGGSRNLNRAKSSLSGPTCPHGSVEGTGWQLGRMSLGGLATLSDLLLRHDRHDQRGDSEREKTEDRRDPTDQ